MDVGTDEVGFQLNTVLFSENGTIAITEFDSEDVYRNTLKWTTMISMWPFLSSSNTLELCIILSSSTDNKYSSKTNTQNMFHFTIDDFSFDIPLHAECALNDINISAKANEYEHNLRICLIFKSCVDETLTHDSFVRFIKNSNNIDPDSGDESASIISNFVFLIIIILVLIFLTIFIGIILVFFCKAKKQKRSSLQTDSDTLDAELVMYYGSQESTS